MPPTFLTLDKVSLSGVRRQNAPSGLTMFHGVRARRLARSPTRRRRRAMEYVGGNFGRWVVGLAALAAVVFPVCGSVVAVAALAMSGWSLEEAAYLARANLGYDEVAAVGMGHVWVRAILMGAGGLSIAAVGAVPVAVLLPNVQRWRRARRVLVAAAGLLFLLLVLVAAYDGGPAPLPNLLALLLVVLGATAVFALASPELLPGRSAAARRHRKHLALVLLVPCLCAATMVSATGARCTEASERSGDAKVECDYSGITGDSDEGAGGARR